MSWLRLTLQLIPRLLVRPADAAAVLRLGWRFRRRGWWRRPPFLPLPATGYLQWRIHTAYGEERDVPTPEELIRFARWAVRPW